MNLQNLFQYMHDINLPKSSGYDVNKKAFIIITDKCKVVIYLNGILNPN